MPTCFCQRCVSEGVGPGERTSSNLRARDGAPSPTDPAHAVSTVHWPFMLPLLQCMDLMDLGDGIAARDTYAEGAARILAESVLIGVKQDLLIPAAELAMLADTINARTVEDAATGHSNGASADSSSRAISSKRAVFKEMDSLYGHDAFLKEQAWLGPQIRAHLERGLEADLAGERVHNLGLHLP